MPREEDDVIMDMLRGEDEEEEMEFEKEGIEDIKKLIDFVNDLIEEDESVSRKELEEYF